MKFTNRLLLISLLAVVIAILYSTPILQARASRVTAQEMNERRGPLGKTISVRAAGRGAPWINLRDGYDLPADYQGTSKTSQALKANQARPVALASADFDEDGIADLVSAYEATGGRGVTIQRGHEDTIFPNGLEAVARRAQSTRGGSPASAVDNTASPFLLSSRAFDVSDSPRLLGTGDFDGDGHADVVAAALGGDKLLLLAGDGRGGLAPGSPIPLPGSVTALATGDVNRMDGLAEIIVGLDGGAGPKLLIFEGGEGAVKSSPEVISLPAAAKSIAIGRLDGDYPIDIAIAAGHNLVIISGRDRKRPSGGANGIDARPLITRLSFSFSILSAAIGDFTGSASQEIALLSDDGAARLMARTAARGGESIWVESSATAVPFDSRKDAGDVPARCLTPLRVSGAPNEDLLLIDSGGHQLHILTAEPAASQPESAPSAQAPSLFRLSASLDVEGEPVDVLPMRLNADALSDLVVVRSNQAAPAVLLTAPSAVFTVTNANDSGAGSLRDAISSANSNPGADAINFNITGGGIKTIKPLSALPLISGTVTIDGTTQSPGSGTPQIELDGGMALPGTKGLSVGAASCVIRGLVINSFDGNGVEVSGGSNVHVEGNFIGTNAGGTAGKANSESGVAIIGGDGNLIGGATASARNVVSGNSSHGVLILGPASGNRVQGNYIGTDKTGAVAIGNGSNGVSLVSGNASVTNSVIGGPAAGNVISGNTGFGVQFFGVGMGNLIQGNLVGTDATGFLDVGNNGGGVAISDAAGNTVGGTVAGEGNVISGNGINGVRINAATASNNRVQGNFIGTALNGSSPLPNDSDGVYVLNSASNTLIGAVSGGGGNIIAFNGRNGVLIETGTANSVLSNSIFSNSGLGVDLGPAGVTPNDTGDFDSGANGLQNFPALTAAASLAGGGISIQGTLNSAAGATFTLQFFASDSCDVSGNGEGQVFLGSAAATTNASGNAAFNVTLSTSASSGQYITATATDAQGSSSEFSACVAFGSSDLAISQTSSPANVTAGNKITYRITVTNNGPDAAVPATLSDNLPPSIAFVTCSAAGGVCGGSGNNRIVSFNSLAPGASAIVTIDAVVNCSAADGFVINNAATVSSVIRDPVAGNNSATAMNTVVNPPPSISPANASFASDGGDSSVSVTITDGCGWAASSNAPWISVPQGAGGVGSGTLDYSVAPNVTASPRTGTITVAGTTFTVNQGTQPCSYSIQPASASVPSQATSDTVTVTALAGCRWKATSNDDWITVTAGAAGAGGGTVFYTVSANVAGNQRTGSITIGDQTFTITQAGRACSYLLSPISKFFGESGTEDGFTVMAPSGCNWTATPSAAWIIVTSDPSGSGTDTITYAVRDNFTTSPRQGTITVAGQTFTIVQDGGTTGDCVFTLAPISASFNSAGGNGSVVVNCEDRCAWGASTNVSWITVTSVGAGIGTRTVTYNVRPNTGATARKGVITIAGKTHTIKQRGM
jgi:uncharacterized repeat protein (TIGR01451 family)